jgi:Tol biopolymer transport system component
VVLVNGTYNVRTGPGTAYSVAGQVQDGQTLEIVGKDPQAAWWQVCCVEDETVWILARLAPSQGATDSVPVSTDIPPTPVPPTPAPTAVTTISPDELTGKIAFPVYDTARRTYDIYVANADGSGLQRVLDEASQPALSPDGQKIAFRRWWGGGRGITVMSTYGGDLIQYSDYLEDGLPSWSADGLALSFFSRRESDRRPRMYVVNLVDRSEWQIVRDREPVLGEYPTWNKDGTIAYRVFWPQGAIAIMNSNASDERVIVSEDTATAPAASPDGAYVAFMSRRDGDWEIYRISSDGSDLLRLTEDGANDGLPAWSPDGSTIAFASDRGGEWGMWAMTADGQGHTRLFALPGAPDGIVADQPDYSSRGWVEERISWSP